MEKRTCIWDQEVHHFNSVKVDHHTTTVGGRRKKEVTSRLWNRVPSLGDGIKCVTWQKRSRGVHGRPEGMRSPSRNLPSLEQEHHLLRNHTSSEYLHKEKSETSGCH